MKLVKDNRTIEVEPRRSQYLFLNNSMIIASDKIDDIWMAKQYVLKTLWTLHLPYHKDINLFDGDDGFVHEVTEISTDVDGKNFTVGTLL